MLTVSKLFKSFNDVHAVRGVDFHVLPGEIFGLLGPNGAGKSTTINMIAGLTNPSSGSVTIKGGLGPHHRKAKSTIGYVPQDLALYESLSARENLRFFATLQGLSGARRKEKVAWALDFSQLEDKAEKAVGTYSGGM
ncbi:ABC transporter ATP-binding protein, partial [Myxococcota bacterium]|nr:ABC transporter ATP-binding protein [Myxococcota bacterium]